MGKQLTLEEVKLLCKELEIEFLNDTYHGTNKKYHFKCACSNTFERRFYYVKQGKINCSTCNGVKPWNVESIKVWCLKKGIEFLGDTYITVNTKYNFKCACGNTFERQFANVFQGQTNCLACSNRTQWNVESIKVWCLEKGMEFLDDAYHGSRKNYNFRCACGNIFNRRFNRVINNNRINCSSCNNKIQWNLESVKAWCMERGIEFLDDTYQRHGNYYSFKCACGETFERSLSVVINDNRINCSDCTNKTAWDLESVRVWCLEQGIEFLSNIYYTNKEKYLFKCACGNTFERSLSDVINKKRTNCTTCSGIIQWDMESVEEWCLEQGIVFLDDIYQKRDDKYKFQCACGNTFERRFSNVIQGQTNCLACSGKTPWDIESVKVWCLEQGIEFLDSMYHNAHVKYNFKCACGETFERSFLGITQGQINCSTCSDYPKGEKRIIEFLIQYDIPYKTQFTFNDLYGESRLLRFDFSITVNDQLLLVEFDGEQHYQPVEYFGGEETFQQIQKNDRKKNEYCEKNNIPLLRIPYYEFDRIEELLMEFIKKY